jgi:hypothetical protein
LCCSWLVAEKPVFKAKNGAREGGTLLVGSRSFLKNICTTFRHGDSVNGLGMLIVSVKLVYATYVTVHQVRLAVAPSAAMAIEGPKDPVWPKFKSEFGVDLSLPGADPGC